MRTLRFVGLDDSGTRLLFLTDDDQEHAIEVDDRLVQAVRRTHGWPRTNETNGDEQADRQVDTQTSELRPREIQARVRAGESPEQVAAAAGVEVERVARFARPVLQEREHVADAAQSVVVRTGALDGPLGEVVADRLAHVVSDTESRWDAWRREDGRWTVSLTFRDDVQERTARWSFDPTTNSVTVDDETSRWLTEGTSPHAPDVPQPAAPRAPGGRRLLSVPDLQPEPSTSEDHLTQVLDLGTRATDDAIEDEDVSDEDSLADELAALGLQVSDPVEDEITALSPVADLQESPREAQTELDLDATGPGTATHTTTATDAPATDAGSTHTGSGVDTDVPATSDERPAAPAAKKARKSAKRASVPSWDDIVFGARKND